MVTSQTFYADIVALVEDYSLCQGYIIIATFRLRIFSQRVNKPTNGSGEMSCTVVCWQVSPSHQNLLAQ